MAADWIGINSSHLDSHCGDDGEHTIEEALNGADLWVHAETETHQFTIDLGQTYDVTKVRSRSNSGGDPIDVNIYVSDDKENWGAAVASGISTWQDTGEWVEVEAIGTGRYVKVEIVDTESGLDWINYGHTTVPFSIFDIYGEEIGDVTVSPSVLTLELDLLTPVILYDVPVTILPSVLALELELLTPTILVGDITVSPSVLTLELDLLTPTILVGDVTVSPSVLTLELELLSPTILYDVPITVMPDVLALELELLTPTIRYKISPIVPDVLALELELLTPRVGLIFPTLSTSPEYEGWVDEHGDETVIRDSYASGYPLLNPQFTFDPKNFRYVLRQVSQADKEILMSFYDDSKNQEIYWLNEQDGETYFVVFTRKPRCQSDGARSLWKLELNLRQVVEL